MEFSRFELLVGEKIEKFKKLSVLIVGIGGVGGYTVEGLARLGINKITIVDYDVVDITNINRQIIALHSTIGLKKIDVLKKRILDINPNCEVEIFDLFYQEKVKEIIFNKYYDYIFDCCDSIKSKESLIREAIARNIKIISSMGAGFKINPNLIKISKLKQTSYDKIAKILRNDLKDNPKCLEIPVIWSSEIVNKNGKIIASNSYIPSIFGLYMVSYMVNEIIKEK